MIDNQFEVAKALENPARFSDQVLQNYKRGMNPMVQPNIAAGEEQRRAMIRNAVQGMMARQQAPAQMPTVVEIEKQKLAQQQAMQQQLINALAARNNTGVATLDTAPGMFSRGGGVVAFNGEDNNQYVQSPEETAPSDTPPKSIFQRLSTVFKPENMKPPDKTVADKAIDIIKEAQGRIGIGQVTGIVEGRFGNSVEEITERFLGKPTSATTPEDKPKKDETPASSARKTDTGKADTGKADTAKNQGIGSLENRLAGIIARTQEISKKLAEETDSERLLKKAITDEMDRSGKFKDFSKEQLDAIAQERIDQMKKESDPLFAQMKGNIQKRRGETVGMTPEERRELFIANLGAQGRGVRNLFGKSLEVDVKQRVENRKLNQDRQDLLDKEEMELARAQMLESRGQRKEADEAKKLALQARREEENLRRQQAQLMIGGTEKLATSERRRQELAYKPEQEELRARREEVMKQYDADRQNQMAAQQAARLAQSPIARDYNALVQIFTSQGMKPEEAQKRALAVATKGQEENMDIKRQNLLARNPEYKTLVEQRAMFALAASKNPDSAVANRVREIDAKIAALEARNGIGGGSGGAAPTGRSISWNDIPG